MAERTHITFAVSTSVLTALLIAAGMAAGKAGAQEARRIQPATPMMESSMKMGERMETADCRTASGVEVAPVSFDAMNAPQAWVIVERAGGDPVSAERIDPDKTVLISSIRCGGDDWLKPSDAPAGS